MNSMSRLSQTFGFALVPGFALMSYASATEPLRAANLLAGQELFTVVPLSPDGNPVISSSGVLVPTRRLDQVSGLHTAFVCAGGNPAQWQCPEIIGALQKFSRAGVRIGGISGGAYLLAAAGLLQGRDFTIHWEHAPALVEAFPTLSPRHTRFVIDNNRITCGGGVAPLDMMHALIMERMGADFARRVSDWYLHIAVSEHSAPQRASIAERYGAHHPVLLNILQKMETTVEQPLDRRSMAAFAGVSERHLDRLFAGHLGVGFQNTYLNLRLSHARRLLQQSPLTLAEIAFATGFSSASHFSRCFKSKYRQTPRSVRVSHIFKPARGIGFKILARGTHI
ncbi:GlxA family transcriptional regulator [Mesorhizobium sp. KR9-304]|uniref:GlxA family transcriptional regulator n=1 Tax=Mesorhizobium sp. KR9-304 TaxID=3156614 RepID=UPI0032B45973